MIAILVIPDPTSRMLGLDATQSQTLLPLGDRPFLQHIVESLVAQKITSIEVIHTYAPERIELLLGDGSRWGCSIRHHLAVKPDRPYRSLKVIPEIQTNSWVLAHADTYPVIQFPKGPIEKPILYYSNQGAEPDTSTGDGNDPIENDLLGVTVAFPAGYPVDDLSGLTREGFSWSIQRLVSTEAAISQEADDWIDVSTPKRLLESQHRLLQQDLDGLLMNGAERQPGVWVSRNVVIHPTVELKAPVYIGPNSRLNRGVKMGPDVVIGGACIIDSDTTIESSLVMAGSYVGEGLELNHTIVDRSLLVNARLSAAVNISESFLLGGINQSGRQNSLLRIMTPVLAALLIVILSPFSLVSILYFLLLQRMSYSSISVAQIPAEGGSLPLHEHRLPCIGEDAWSVLRPAGWNAFLRQFLPGLFAVVRGHVGLVGLPPRSRWEIERLPSEWRSIYLNGRAGLITEASVAVDEAQDETQLFVSDAYYSVQRIWHYDLRLAARYFLRLLSLPDRNLPESGSAADAERADSHT